MKVIPHSPLVLVAALVGCGSFEPNPIDDLDLDCSIPVDQIAFGGVARDGIPALSNPDIATATDAFLRDEERVMGVVIDGEARAYPMTVLWWHEIVNDDLGDLPILVTYCPLTGSGIVFDRTIDGTVREFGVSGLLFENNLMMFDRATESLWTQMLLGSQCGLERGRSLSRLPVIETTWGHWKTLHPQTTAVTTNTGFIRQYGVYPYGDYAVPENNRLSFPGSPFSNLRPAKEPVLGIHQGTESVAYPFGALADMAGSEDAIVLNDTLGTLALAITYASEAQTAIAFDRQVDGETLTFEVLDAGAMTFRDLETQTTWDATGLAVAGPLEGTQLTQVSDAYVVFWFAWSVYYPNTRLVT